MLPSTGETHDRGRLSDAIIAPAPAPIDRELLAQCYEELRVVARRLLGRDWVRLPIQPTELAHEAMMRLLQMERLVMNDRRHLLATAARLARQTLIDEARRLDSRKRATPAVMLTLLPDVPAAVLLEDVRHAVAALATVSADHAAIVEMRFTLGMTMRKWRTRVVCRCTVKRRWTSARPWMQDWLEIMANEPDRVGTDSAVHIRALTLFDRLADQPSPGSAP